MPTFQEEFTEFTQDVSKWNLTLAALASASPVLDLITNLGPTWPNRVAVATITAIGQLLLFIAVFLFLRDRTYKTMYLCVGIGIALVVGFGIAYGCVLAYWTHPMPDNANREAIGIWHTQVAKDYLKEEPNATLTELVESVQYDVERLYSLGSLRFIQIMWLGSWLLFFTSLQFVLAAFGTIAAKKNKLKRKPSTAEGPTAPSPKSADDEPPEPPNVPKEHGKKAE